MKIKLIRLCVIAASLALTGCATPARIDEMTARHPMLAPASHPYREQIAVREATGGSDTNPMWTAEIGTSEFERALEQSLNAAGLGAPRQAGRYYVTADLTNVDKPLLGFNMTVTTKVRYIVVERQSGKTVFDRVEEIPYTATLGDAVLGYERLKLAIEGSARSNITRFISDLIESGVKDVSLQ